MPFARAPVRAGMVGVERPPAVGATTPTATVSCGWARCSLPQGRSAEIARSWSGAAVDTGSRYRDGVKRGASILRRGVPSEGSPEWLDQTLDSERDSSQLRFKKFARARLEARFFAVGSALFALGAFPGWTNLVGAEADNVTFALGSVFFTIAAFVQLRLTGRWRVGAWRGSARADWWSAAVQLLGTVLFNFSTFAAVAESLGAGDLTVRVWAPDAFGSAAFLLSSALAVQAVRLRDRLWDPRVRSWEVAWANLAGSIAFGVSAVAGYLVDGGGGTQAVGLMNLGTFVGGLLFLTGALLMPHQGSAASEASPGPGSG